MKRFSGLLKSNWPVILIISAGFLLRIKGLTFQSLWLDELHTMNEADPNTSLKEMFYALRHFDQHPPLYFIIERIAFMLFGHSEFIARFISVIAGTLSIAAIYSLGKEMLNKSLGLITAILCCVNFYNLSYSQEARGYIFAFLFVILSFLYFIRLIREPKRANVAGYAVFTLALLYSHYYSLFIVCAQAILGLIFIFQERREDRTKLFRAFVISGIIILVGYAAWLPFLYSMTEIKSFWIGNTDSDFLENYFYAYFGNSELLKPVLISLLLVYLLRVAGRRNNLNEPLLKTDPVLFSFLLFLFWIFVTLLIPYLRSLQVVPMLYPRYTIVVLPAILLAIGFGIEHFGRPLLKYAITGLIVVISLISIFFEKGYYREISKSQFREMTGYVVKNNGSNYPLINEMTAWHQRYYLNKFGSKAVVITGSKEAQIDTILRKSTSANYVKGFWIVGAHSDVMPAKSKLEQLDAAYILVKQKLFFQAWAQLYVSRRESRNVYTTIRSDQFVDGSYQPEDSTVAIWSGSIISRPVLLEKGKYNLIIYAKGSKGDDQFPHLTIYVNGRKVGDFYVTQQLQDEKVVFENPAKGDATITIEMNNDFSSPGRGDRNAFIQRIVIEQATE